MERPQCANHALDLSFTVDTITTAPAKLTGQGTLDLTAGTPAMRVEGSFALTYTRVVDTYQWSLSELDLTVTRDGVVETVAGDTIELVARHLHGQGLGRMIIANRRVENAHTIAAALNGFAIGLDEVDAHLAEADIVVSATASPEPLLTRASVAEALKQRRRRPMFLVDLAVPRDIEAAVAELPDAYLYTVLRWTARIDMDLAKWPSLKAYVDRVGARPKVQEALKAEGLAK